MASGTLTLKDVQPLQEPGQACSGTSGYDDIRGGAQVVVTDADGSRVGLGELEGGVRQESTIGTSSGWCEFEFEVADIPDAEGLYSIEVAGRGGIEFERSDADALKLTLG